MSDDYRMRKDIDRFSLFLDNLETELKQKYGTSDLRNALSVFYDSSEVDVFVNKLKTDLTDLNTSLDDLALDLYGDDNVKGFVDYLNELQHLIYGKGDKDTSGRDYTIDYPSPNSLKGLLNKLNGDMTDLSGTLTVLATYLVNFSGTLNEFKQLLASHGISYASLDSGITQLLEGIFQAQVDIDTVQEDIGDVSQISGTVVGNLQQIDTKAVDIRKKMYSGTDDTGTIDNPATGTVKANLNTAQDDIGVLDTMVGTVNVSRDGNLQNQVFNVQDSADLVVQTNNSWQFILYGSTSVVDLYPILTRTGISLHEIHYAYDGRFKINDGASWKNYDETIILDKVDFSCVVSEYGLNPQVKSFAEEHEITYILDIYTQKFYNYTSYTWQEISDYYTKMFFNKLFSFDINRIYPVGAIYISINEVNPTMFLGGTWVQLQDTFLYATSGTSDDKDTNNNDITTAPAGQGEATHTLTENEMPSHTHNYRTNPYMSAERDTSQRQVLSEGNDAAKYVTKTTYSAGGGQAHNNMPPYMKVYMWKRTA